MNGLQISLTLPDLWQQEAVRGLKAGHDVVVDAPTGAGKTWVFELYFEQGGLQDRGQAIYTVPTRALANDKWLEWKRKGWDVGIATGDLAENLDAPVIVATLETQRERFLRDEGPALLVVDEYQMIADASRGLNYELALSQAPSDTQLLLLSGSVANPNEIAEWFESLGRTCDLIRVSERPVPLDEIPVETLPRAPRQIKNFWAQVAARALLGNHGPLLIFVPHRKGAEKLARQISSALPEDDPVPLTPQQENLLGKDLTKMLKSRVAWHHSGLSYTARAGIIEPLAKHGQLRVIVATMGLAAGINFSVRSVLVSGTTYYDGPYQRDVRADELLQMFGRAGRRGLDEIGFVLTTRDSPGLIDTAPLRLRRVQQVDWPTLLRVMERASIAGSAPLDAAREVCDRLFSRQNIELGFDTPHEGDEEQADDSFLQRGPHRTELKNSSGAWEPEDDLQTETRPLRDCLVYEEDQWIPALQARDTIDSLERGKICRLKRDSSFVYGKERQIARFTREGDLQPLPWVRKLMRLRGKTPLTTQAFENEVLSPIRDKLEAGAVEAAFKRGKSFVIRVDYSAHTVEARIDSAGKAILNPPNRRVAIDSDTAYTDESGDRLEPPPNSAAFAWRKLNLVDADGIPTRRGRIFSRFQRGEGLLIAAALEDETYPLDELAWHLANLRAGIRFADSQDDTGSSRLTATARAAFGTQSYEGYLELGLCPGYGEGAAEVVGALLGGDRDARSQPGETISKGDIERAIVEWLSLLRHIVHAADVDWDRWHDFKSTAADLLKRHARPQPDLPELPANVLDHKLRHRPPRI